MDTNGNFKSRWLDSLQTLLSGQTASLPERPDAYEKKLLRLAQKILTITNDEPKLKELKTDKEIISNLISKIRSSNGNGNDEFSLCLREYNSAYHRLKLLHDKRVQESQTDLNDRLRFLLFRILTAIGIASVVLLTGYLAKTFEIPLPLLRLP